MTGALATIALLEKLIAVTGIAPALIAQLQIGFDAIKSALSSGEDVPPETIRALEQQTEFAIAQVRADAAESAG
jgi:hypothetical protein